MEKINHGFDNLKKLLPPPERKLSKSAVLQQAVQHIKLLQRTVVQIKMENQDLKRRVDALSTSVKPGANNSPVKLQSTHDEDELKENVAVSQMTQETMMASEGSVDRYDFLSKKQKEDTNTAYKHKQHRRALTSLDHISLNENYCPNMPRNFSEKKQKISRNLKPVHRFSGDATFTMPLVDYSFPASFTPGLALPLSHPNSQKALPALSNYKRIAPYPWKPQASLQSPSAVVGRVTPFQSTMNRCQPHQSKTNKSQGRGLRQQHLPNSAVNSLDTIVEAIKMIENDPFENRKHEINPSRSTRADKIDNRGSF